MKKILFLGIVVLTVFVIYLANMDRKVYYLALGNSSKYVNNFKGYSFYVSDYLSEKDVLERYVWQYSSDDKRITDIINDIKENKTYKNGTLKNSLIKADLVTLSIDASDVFEMVKSDGVIYNDVYEYIDDLTLDLEKLFKLMREYCKEDVVFIGYYNCIDDNSDVMDIIDYLNRKYKEVAKEYNVLYVDISDLNDDCIDLNDICYKKISNKIIKVIDNSLFEA